MSSSMNIHRTQRIVVRQEEANGHKWTSFDFTDDMGQIFSLAVHSADWLPIEGADHINHVAQEVAA